MGSTPESFLTSFDELQRKREEEEEEILAPDTDRRLSVVSKDRTPPDRAGRMLNLQMKTGLPADFVDRNLDDLEARVEQRDFDVDEFKQRAPIFADWVAENPNHWSLVKDDWENMGNLEWAWKAFWASRESGFAEAEMNELYMLDQQGVASEEDLKRIEDLEKEVVGHDFGAGEWGEIITATGKLEPNIAAGMRAGALHGTATALVAGGATLLAGPAGAPLTIPAATAGFAGGSLVGMYKHAQRQETGAMFREFLSIVDETGRPLDREVARVAAGYGGQLSAVLEASGTFLVAKNLPGVRQLKARLAQNTLKEALKNVSFQRALMRFAGRTLESVGGEVITELAQQGVNIVAGELAKNIAEGDFADITSDEVMSQLMDIAELTLKGTILIGGAGPTVNLGLDSWRARRARQNRSIFEAIGEHTANSKTKERLPEKHREFVERIRKNGDVENIRIPIEEFKTYFQSQGIEPEVVASELTGDAKAWEQAELSQGDLVIKIEDYTDKVAGGEHHAGLIPHLRVHESDMTYAENEQYLKNREKLLAELKESLGDDVPYDPVPEIYDTVKAQLLAAGSDEVAAEHQATLHEQVFSNLARMEGLDPVALFNARFGGVTREDVVPTGLTFEQTLYHGSVAAFDQFALEQIGAGEGFAAYGWGLYFAENEDVAGSYRAVGPVDDPGYLYEIQVPDDTKSRMLDWDAPLNEQEELLERVPLFRDFNEAYPGQTGAEAYDMLMTQLGTGIPGFENRQKLASEYLRELGVPGIRYYDAGSRGITGGGGFIAPALELIRGQDTRTRNIVLFDPDLITEVKRDGTVVYVSDIEKISERAGRADEPFSAPPIRPDGTVELTHYSRTEGIEVLDPGEYGKGIRGAEAERKLADPTNWVDRTYYGIGIGQEGGYQREYSLGHVEYKVSIPAELLYDIWENPDKLNTSDGIAAYEKAIQDAGYLGYWRKHDSLGLVAAVYEKMPVISSAKFFNQSALRNEIGLYSAVEQATIDLKIPEWKPVSSDSFTPAMKERMSVLVEKVERERLKIYQDIYTVELEARENELIPVLQGEVAEYEAGTRDRPTVDTSPARLEYLELKKTLKKARRAQKTFDDNIESLPEQREYRKLQTKKLNASEGAGSASGKAVWAKIKKMPGVKQEELKWLGLEEFLLRDAKQKFYRSQVIDFIQENGVRVEETVGVIDPDNIGIDEDDITWHETIDTDSSNWDHRVEDFLYEFDRTDFVAGEGEVDHIMTLSDWLDTDLNFKKLLDEMGVVVPDEEQLDLFFKTHPPATADNVLEMMLAAEGELGIDVEEVVRTAMRDDFEELAGAEAEAEYMDNPNVSYYSEELNVTIYGNDDMGYTVDGGEFRDIYSFNEAEIQAIQTAREEGTIYAQDETAEEAAQWADYVEGDYADYRELKLKLPDVPGTFRQTAHFPDDNIVAFLRVTNRSLVAKLLPHDPEPLGKRAESFHIDEFQSDWHQQGRQDGYKTGRDLEVLEGEANSLVADAQRMKQRLYAELQDNFYKLREQIGDAEIMAQTGLDGAGLNAFGATLTNQMSVLVGNDLWRIVGDYVQKYGDEMQLDAMNEIAELTNRGMDLQKEATRERYGVPDAPFKGNNWLQLGLKRALVEAVEQGYTTFSWADSQTLVDRWSANARQMYEIQYDKKMPSMVKKLTGQTPQRFTWDGIPWVARERELTPAVGYWAIELTPSLSEQIKTEGFTLFQEGDRPRAQIHFDNTNKAIISLLESADLSSFLHESGHLYLELLGDLYERPDATPELRQLYNDLLQWLDVKDRSQITDKHHEKLAKGFEAYLMEGRAPSVALQSAFAAFKEWMRLVYSTMNRRLNVQINDDIRSVFDRILASEGAIQEAHRAQEYVQLYATREEAGMNVDEWKVYQATMKEAHQQEDARLTAQLLDVQAREQKRWWKAEQKRVRTEVTAEVHQMPVYRVLSFLTLGKNPDGTEPDIPAVKLDRDELYDNYSKEEVLALPRPYIYAVKDGVSMDIVATQFDYSSGAAMIADIQAAPKMSDLINRQTTERLAAEFPDPMLDGSVTERALETVHNDKRATVLLAELRAARRKQAEVKPFIEAAQAPGARAARDAQRAIPGRDELAMIKAGVREMIGGMEIRNVNPNQFLVAEQKAGRLAHKAALKGDHAVAGEQKRTQIVNHELYREALRARKETDKIQRYFKKFSRRRVIEVLGKANDGGIEQIHEILAGIDLRQISSKEIDRNKARAELTKAIEDGMVIAPPDVAALLADSRGTNWRELTVDELKGTRDVIKQLEHFARKHSFAVIHGEKLHIKNEALKIAEAMVGANKKIPLGFGTPTGKETRREVFRSAISGWLGSGVLARILENDDFGPLYRKTVEVIRRAVTEKLVPMEVASRKDITEIYLRHYNNKQLKALSQRVYIAGLDRELTRSDLISMLLNWGTEGNRQAVLEGITIDGEVAYTAETVAEIFSHLTETDVAFVEDIWKYIDSYWAELSAAEKRRRGIAPQKVEASPITIQIAGGRNASVAGGYYPLSYDRRHSKRAKDIEDTQHMKNLVAGVHVSAHTRAGATYNRVQHHQMVVRLGVGLIDKHLREIIRDIAMGDEVNFVKRLLNDPDLQNSFLTTGNEPALEVMKNWLVDSAVGELPADNVFDRLAVWARVGFTINKLALNLVTTLLQITGLPQTMAVIGTQAFGYGIGKFAANPIRAHRTVMERSAFMRTRYQLHAWDKDAADAKQFVERSGGGVPTRGHRIKNNVASLYFYPIAMAQRQVDEISWLGAYWKGVNKKNLSEQDAVLYADGQVELAQTSGLFPDRSALERGTLSKTRRQLQWIRIWTTLISYMLRKGGLGYGKIRAYKQGPKTILNSVYLVTDLMLLFTTEAILTAYLHGDSPDEDESYLWWVAKGTLDSISQGVPFVREVATAKYGSGSTPIGSLATSTWRAGEQIGQIFEEGLDEPNWEQLDEALIKNLNDVGATLLHYPGTFPNRMFDAFWREQEGEDVAPIEYFIGERDEEEE